MRSGEETASFFFTHLLLQAGTEHEKVSYTLTLLYFVAAWSIPLAMVMAQLKKWIIFDSTLYSQTMNAEVILAVRQDTRVCLPFLKELFFRL